MYAVIQTGGKQYRVSAGDFIEVEKLPVEVGGTLDLDQVLLVSDDNQVTVGQPTVAAAKVTATVKAHGRGKKVIVYKHFKNYHKKQGHRQDYTRLLIDQITVGGSSINLNKSVNEEVKEVAHGS
jgi:large subunit ribosomal protein L21